MTGPFIARKFENGVVSFFDEAGFETQDVTQACQFATWDAAHAFIGRERLREDEPWEVVLHPDAEGADDVPTPEELAADTVTVTDEPADPALAAEVVDAIVDAPVEDARALEPAAPKKRKPKKAPLGPRFWRAGAKETPAGEARLWLRDGGQKTIHADTAATFETREACEVFLSSFDWAEDFEPVECTRVPEYPTVEAPGPEDDAAPASVVVFTPAVEDPAPDADPRRTTQGEFFEPGATSGTRSLRVVELASPGAARLLARAVADRVEHLEKRAKDLRNDGYEKEAGVLAGDVAVLKDEVLSQLEPQVRLPLGHADVHGAMTARLAGKLRRRVRETLTANGRPVGVTVDDWKADVEAKLDDYEAVTMATAEAVAALVLPILRETASRGYTAGRLAREAGPDMLAMQAVESVTARET